MISFLKSNIQKIKKISKFIFIGGALFLLLSSLAWSADLPCDVSQTNGNVNCASFWSVKYATRKSAINYIWIIYLTCGVISVMLLKGSLNAFKQASDGGQGAGLKKPLTLIVLAGCMISLPYIAKVMVDGSFDGNRAGESVSTGDDISIDMLGSMRDAQTTSGNMKNWNADGHTDYYYKPKS